MILKNRYKKNVNNFFINFIICENRFRLKPELECCNDDHDYYIHAETTIIDFDFEYENQLEGFEKEEILLMVNLLQLFLWNRFS